MSDQGPGYGLREHEWKATASSYGPGYGLRDFEDDPADQEPRPAPQFAPPAGLLGVPQSSTAASLAVSPAWLAFRRSLGIEDATDAATAQAKIDALNRRAGLARGDLVERGKDQRQGIADSYETRGLLRSGARLRDQAKQQGGEGAALADLELTLAEQQAQLMAQLAQRQAERQRTSAERALSVADRETVGGY